MLRLFIHHSCYATVRFYTTQAVLAQGFHSRVRNRHLINKFAFHFAPAFPFAIREEINLDLNVF